MTNEIQTHLLEHDGTIPNNPRFPLLVYPNAFPSKVSPEQIQDCFSANRWHGNWVNGVFDYHHYHSTAHEVLGCFSGSATVQFGGESGPKIEIAAGAGVVIPAGVGHKNLGSSSDFGVVGAYPPGQDWDLCERDDGSHAEVIANVGKPPTDPFFGECGALIDLWK